MAHTKHMNPYFEIIRPVNGIMAAVAVWIGTIVAGAGFAPSDLAMLGMVAVFLISSAGMILNDIFDINIDKVNRPERPLPSGRMTKKSAYTFAAFLFIIGNVLSFLINSNVFIIAIFASVILVAYAARLKKIIMVGHIGISLLVALTFVYGGFIIGNYIATIPLALLAFLSNTGREVYKSIEDVLGDKKMGVETLAAKYGVFKAKMIASIFIILAIIFSFLPYALNILGIIYLFFVIIADIVFLLSIILPVRHSANVCKIAMIIALIAFIAGAVA
jgi:geranylgeranylglycerol-phosphate geranylgeranyltransferase